MSYAPASGPSVQAKAYGARFDGNSYPAGATLGITTAAGLAGYSLNGGQPYGFVRWGMFGVNCTPVLRAAAAAAATSLSVDSTVALYAGMLVVCGTKIPLGTTIASVSRTAPTSTTLETNTVALTLPSGKSITALNAWQSITCLGGPRVTLTTTAASTSGAGTLTFASTATLWVGMYVLAPGVPAGAVIRSLTATTVTLGDNEIANGGATLGAAIASGTSVIFVGGLTDAQAQAAEMDMLGVNAAIQAVAATPRTSGAVQMPAGNGRVGPVGIILPSTGAAEGIGANYSVDLRGASQEATMLYCSGFGPGQAVVSCGDPTGSYTNGYARYGFNYYSGECSDFTVLGDAQYQHTNYKGTWIGDYANNTLASAGVIAASRRKLRNVAVVGHRYGVTRVGDHTLWTYVYGQDCAFGCYWEEQHGFLLGDIQESNCFFQGNSYAGVAAHPASYITGTFQVPYWGGNTYNILKQAGSPNHSYDGTAQGGNYLLQDALFLHPQLEWAGNCTIHDENGMTYASGTWSRTGAKTAWIGRTKFVGSFWNWEPNNRAANRPWTAFVDVAHIGMEVDLPGDPGQMNSPTNGFLFNAGTVDRLVIRGQVEALVSNLNSNATVFINASAAGATTNAVLELAGYKARFISNGGTVAVAAGDAIEYRADGSGQQSTGSGAFLGIAIAAMPVGNLMPVAVEGTGVTANTSTVTTGGPVVAGAGGKIVAAGTSYAPHLYAGVARGDQIYSATQVGLKLR